MKGAGRTLGQSYLDRRGGQNPHEAEAKYGCDNGKAGKQRATHDGSRVDESFGSDVGLADTRYPRRVERHQTHIRYLRGRRTKLIHNQLSCEGVCMRVNANILSIEGGDAGVGVVIGCWVRWR